MKFIFSLLFLLNAAQSFSQATVTVKWSAYKPPVNGDTIYYNPSQKLIWSDFKGTPEKGSDATAITSSGFGFNAWASNRNGNAFITVTVYCYFSKQKSWVIKGRESDYALTHEQHHFDVTWIAANNFFNKLKAASFTWQNYNELLDKIYNGSMKELEKMQNQYDGDTRNGRLIQEQARWNKKITDALKSLATN
jgi:hypothetical protein